MPDQKDDYQKMYISLAATTNYIVESVDIANGVQTIAHQPDVPRNLTITVTDANTSIDAGIITIIGKDVDGKRITDVLDLTDALTLTTDQAYASIDSITVSELHGEEAGDTIIVGIGSLIQVKNGNGRLKAIVIGTTANGTIGLVDGITGSTVNILEFKANVAAKTYKFGLVFAAGLRIVLGAASKITVIYY